MKQGFTLIETIIYTAIIVFVSIIIVEAVLTMTSSFYNIRITKGINEGARSSMERMIREVRAASSVDPTSAFGYNPGYLKLNTTDSDGNPATVEFLVENNSLKIKNNAGPAEILTSPNISISSLIFRQIIISGTLAAIKIELELNAALKNNTLKTEKFYDTALLRAGNL